MIVPIKISLLFIFILISCKSQKTDSVNFLSRDYYRSFNIDSTQTESKSRVWNYAYKKYDTVYIFRTENKLFARVDSIPPIELTKKQVEKIHFTTLEDRSNLNKYFKDKYKIDSLIIKKNITAEEYKIIGEYFNYYKNYYVIEKIGDKYYKYKVFLRRKASEKSF